MSSSSAMGALFPIVYIVSILLVSADCMGQDDKVWDEMTQSERNAYVEKLEQQRRVATGERQQPQEQTAGEALRGRQRERLHFPREYYECILDRMPEVQTDSAAANLRGSCWNEYPADRVEPPKKESGWFTKTAGDCIAKYASDTPSEHAVAYISNSCRALYPATD